MKICLAQRPGLDHMHQPIVQNSGTNGSISISYTCSDHITLIIRKRNAHNPTSPQDL